MDRSERKNARLKEKLEAIRKEMGRVEGNIHDLNRAVSNPDRQSAIRRLRQVEEDLQRREEAAAVELKRSAAAPSSISPQEPASPPDGGGSDTGDPQAPRMTPDQRFASYFVTGSLHSVRPLRTERRTQRNKAIFMLVLAILVLYWVISLLLKMG